jgi:hypothetical protein
MDKPWLTTKAAYVDEFSFSVTRAQADAEFAFIRKQLRNS